MRTLPMLLCVLCLGGCLGTLAAPGPDQGREGLRRKIVASKQEPNLLHAFDGTTCVTTAERWQKVNVGQSFLCAWRRG